MASDIGHKGGKLRIDGEMALHRQPPVLFRDKSL
jgi:hypothetical protein